MPEEIRKESSASPASGDVLSAVSVSSPPNLDPGKYGFEAGVVSAGKEADEVSFAVQSLSPEPEGAQYAPELERLCRIAASVGAERSRAAPLSFTALVIAFLFAEDEVSRWFQNYVGSRNIDRWFCPSRFRASAVTWG
jgi:hypothetical protein